MQLEAGMNFTNVYMPKCSFQIIEVSPADNVLQVVIHPENPGHSKWFECWNLEHSIWAFEKGEYLLELPTPQPIPTEDLESSNNHEQTK